MNQTIIYGLADPRSLELRYIGKTSQTLKQRMKEHRYDALGRKRQLYSSKWLRTVYESKLLPIVEIFEVVPLGGDWAYAEKRWIEHWRKVGLHLTNLTDGGEGLAGLKRPQHVIDAVRKARLGRNMSEEAKTKMRAAWTQERRAAMGKLKRATKYSEEVRKRMSESAKLRIRSPEELAACASRLDKVRSYSTETRAKQSISLKAAWARNPERRIVTAVRAKEVLSRPETIQKMASTKRGKQATAKQLECLALGWNRKKNAPDIRWV